MTRPTQETHYELARRELVAIDAACDHVIKCESGEFWITVEGPRDIILGPGESFRADGKEAVVVSALKAGVLVVTHPCAGVAACMPRRDGAELTLAKLLRWKVGPLAALPATRIG